MPRFLLTLAVFTAVYIVLTPVATEEVFHIDDHCWTNGTHYQLGNASVVSMYPCWVAFCNNEQKLLVHGNRCGAGPDIMYGKEELKSLLSRYCYPSAKSELPGDQCCGGYPICFHKGVNRKYFNIVYYLKILIDWQNGVYIPNLYRHILGK
ncbi:uncharacterized protein LOC135473943 [Liolophura sinensis]|uniref:uncharacterized protein LOC135473943 n=1 Tax=Liolophura sinensis TaxID=3198878 RepID=UPI003157F369